MTPQKSPYTIHNLHYFNTALSRFFATYKMTRQQQALYRTYHYEKLSEQFEKDFEAMAAKKGKSKSNRFDGAYQFAAITLNSDDAVVVREWMAKNEADYNIFYDNLLRADWKLSVRWVEDEGAMVCSATMTDEDDLNHHIVVTSWSDNPFEAFMLTYWKIFVLYAGKRLPTEAHTGRWG